MSITARDMTGGDTGALGRLPMLKAATQSVQPERVPAPKSPMVGSFDDCCARAASGQPVTPLPRSAMNSRRLMGLTPGQGSRNYKYSRCWGGSVARSAIKSGARWPP